MHGKKSALLFAVLALRLAAQAPPAPAPGIVKAEPGNPYQRAGQLAPRIMNFTATPASIQPGQSVNLAWLAENPSNMTIEPGVGKVNARGNIQVTPTATTTYTLTVTGAANALITKTVTVTVAGTAPVQTAAAAPAAEVKKEVPRDRNGKPDFSGVYNNTVPRAPGAAPAGRPAAPAAAAAPAPGTLPNAPTAKPGAEKFKVVRAAEDAGVYANCMPVVTPQAFGVPYQFQMVQNANTLIILHEYPGTFRIIEIGGTHPEDPDPTWLGHSVGKWEGDTLVVDTVGFNDKTELNGFNHTEAMHIVERFKRPTFDVIEYEAVIEDPNVFATPWRQVRSFGLRSDLKRIDEFVCEHNEDYTKFFTKKP